MKLMEWMALYRAEAVEREQGARVGEDKAKVGQAAERPVMVEVNSEITGLKELRKNVDSLSKSFARHHAPYCPPQRRQTRRQGSPCDCRRGVW